MSSPYWHIYASDPERPNNNWSYVTTRRTLIAAMNLSRRQRYLDATAGEPSDYGLIMTTDQPGQCLLDVPKRDLHVVLGFMDFEMVDLAMETGILTLDSNENRQVYAGDPVLPSIKLIGEVDGTTMPWEG